MAENEVPSTFKKHTWIQAPEEGKEAKPSNFLLSMLNQVQVHLDSKLEAIQTSLAVIKSPFDAMDHKIETLATNIAYLRTHLPTPHESHWFCIMHLIS